MTPETIAAALAFFQGKCVAVKSTTTDNFYEISSNGGEAYFDDRREYRILPDLPWYRVALMEVRGIKYTTTAEDCNDEASMQSDPDFIGWLDERKTYDPEQVGK